MENWKLIGLVLLITGLFGIYSFHRQSLISYGRELCEAEYSAVIIELKKKAAIQTEKAKSERESRDRFIDTKQSEVIAPVSSAIISGLYVNKGNSGQ